MAETGIDVALLTPEQRDALQSYFGIDEAVATEAATRAAADAALQTAINNFVAQSGVPANYVATNPSIQSDPTWQLAIKREVTYDSSVVNPSFSTIQLESNILYATYGINNVNAVAKTTFMIQGNLLHSPAHGQRIMYANQIDAIGCGDAVISDNTINVYGGVEDGGGEGTKWYRNVIEQGRYIFKSTITSVAKATISTTLSQNITRNKNPQTVFVANASGVSVGQWVQFDVGPPGSAAYAAAEAVKVLAVDTVANTITARFDNNHTSGALIKGSVVLTFGSGTSTGQGRYCVNLSHSGYAVGTAGRKVQQAATNEMTGVGTNWSNSMVGGDVNNPGVISFDADNVSVSPFSPANPLRVYYPIASVASATSLIAFRRDQVGVANYIGNAMTAGAYQVRPGARVMMTGEPVPSRYYSIVVLESNEFTWQTGNQVEWAHSNCLDISGMTYRFIVYSPGMTCRTGIEVSNAGLQEFETGIVVGSYGASAGWKTGAQLAGTIRSLLLAPGPSARAIDILTANGSTGRIAWTEAGPYIEYVDGGGTFRGLQIQTNKGGQGANNGMLRFATPTFPVNSVMEWFGNIKLITTSGSESSPKLISSISGGTEWSLEYDGTGPIFRRIVNGVTTSFRPTLTQI